ncbi:hypothetical protein EYC80_001870 [Monilinia laxa]|uniref:Uncharacterized protein n=1 Tax=Monilinia laxa TaxID=61186 RepID=A0A5N6K687_MONLA|nr:hypothetical protein EYC80_001870 [Monilinia laxa]
MDQIFKIKDAVINYLSPVAKRRRTMGPQTPGCDRVEDEHQFLSEPRNHKRTLEFTHDRTNQTFITLDSMRTPSRNPLKRPREDDQVEGLIFSGDEISPKHSSSQNITESDDGSEGDPDLMDQDQDEEKYDDDEISAEQKVNEYLAKQAAELAKAKETVERARAEGVWSPEEIFLLERLQYMGHEGLLPHWPKAYYFKTIPEAMWCDKDDRNAFLGDSPEDQMTFHAESWRRSLLRPSPILNALGETEIYFRRPPIIYGILYIQAKALFVTLDSSNPEAKIRDIHVCDFLDSSKHFWHAVSVAIVAKIAQKYMETFKDELEDDDPPESNSDSDNELESRGQRERRLQKEAKRLEQEKERQREEDLLRLEKQMECIKVEDDADHVLESIEEYEKVDVIEGEEEMEEEEEDDRPSESVYDEDEDIEVEVEEDEDMEQSQGEAESGEETQYVEDFDEEDGDSNENASENDNRGNDSQRVEPGYQYKTERNPELTSSEEL